jgi:cell division ATPase FtsA
VFDIGFEKTSIGIFKNFALIHSKTFPIGIHHVTKDISRGCSLSLDEAKYIRDQIGCFYWEKDMDLEKENNLPEKFFKQSKFRKITKSLVSEIITARVEEIIKIIKKEIYVIRSGLTAGHNIFIAGGGSHLPQ